MAILRTILHQYLVDDVLPAEHVQDWVDWTGEAREHFEVDHDPDTGEHRVFVVPIAAAIVDRVQDGTTGKYAHVVRTSYGFSGAGARIDEKDGATRLVFDLPENVGFWQGRFTARWKLRIYTNAAPTLAPVVMRIGTWTGALWLEGPDDPDQGDANVYYPNYGGTLVVIGTKE